MLTEDYAFGLRCNGAEKSTAKNIEAKVSSAVWQDKKSQIGSDKPDTIDGRPSAATFNFQKKLVNSLPLSLTIIFGLPRPTIILQSRTELARSHADSQLGGDRRWR